MLITVLIGSVASTEGRYIAATKITLVGSLLFGCIWSLSILVTLLLVRKKYSRGRFHLWYLVTLFVSHVLGIYLVILAMGKVNGPWADLAGNTAVLLIGAFLLTLLLYILSLPYLVLIRFERIYGSRFAILVDSPGSGKQGA
jgi:hypothetical protein